MNRKYAVLGLVGLLLSIVAYQFYYSIITVDISDKLSTCKTIVTGNIGNYPYEYINEKPCYLFRHFLDYKFDVVYDKFSAQCRIINGSLFGCSPLYICILVAISFDITALLFWFYN